MKERIDSDGIRTTARTKGRGLERTMLAAVAVAIAFAVYLLLPLADSNEAAESNPAAAAGQPVSAAAPPAPAGTRRSVTLRQRTGNVATSPSGAGKPHSQTRRQADDGHKAVPEIDAGEYIAALRDAGETEGLAAFNPPGTRPVQSGIIVPDDYELPEGYARHYQTTDDGRQLAAVLTLLPDYDIIDENGNPIALPQDRIVPPELAPPDLPIRVLELPSSSDRTKGAR